MSVIEHDPNQVESAEAEAKLHPVATEGPSAHREAAGVASPARARASVGRTPAAELSAGGPPSDAVAHRNMSRRQLGTRWWLLAAGAAALLTVLTIAAVYLITRKPSTVDQLVILTVPSGAEIKLDSKDYGNSPVKLEQVPIGTYTLEITKEGYEPIIEQIIVSESQPLERKLKPLMPTESVGLSSEELIKQYQQRAEEAFARNQYASPFEGSALYYSDLILGRLDPSNQFATDMKERIRKALHQSAQAAIARGDVGQAQEVYKDLTDNFPSDEEAGAALARIESQLSARRGEVRDLVRKAEEAFRSGNLIEPGRASAYYYSKQALAIDRQNAQARAVRNQVREKLADATEQLIARGETGQAVSQLEQIIQLFPEDKPLRVRLTELKNTREAEPAHGPDPKARRLQGLEKYRREDFTDAIPDLEFSVVNGTGTSDVIFALARSYMKTGQFGKAETYFRRVPQAADDQYRSAIAALGDIAAQRGDQATALDHYKEARRLGGSTLYSVPILDDKIEQIEKRQRDKAAEPTPISIRVKHLHGSLRGSCTGMLTVSATGIRYEGSEHSFSANLVGVSVRVSKDEMTVQFQNGSQKFSAVSADAERFRETLSRYQQSYSPSNK